MMPHEVLREVATLLIAYEMSGGENNIALQQAIDRSKEWIEGEEQDAKTCLFQQDGPIVRWEVSP